MADRDTPVAAPPPPPPPPPDDEPKLELKFDEGSGTVAQDTSGGDHDGTLTGAGAGWTTSGVQNGALDLDGTGMVTVADHADLDVGSTMTLEAYVRPGSTRSWQTVLMKESPPYGQTFSMYATSGGAQNPNAWVGSRGINPSGNLPLNQWTHVAFTLEDGVGRLYRDGSLISVTPGMGAAQATTGPLRIGNNSMWANEGFIGSIDEVRVWDVALSADEIAEHVPGATGSPTSAPKAPACLVSKSKRHRAEPGKCKKRKR